MTTLLTWHPTIVKFFQHNFLQSFFYIKISIYILLVCHLWIQFQFGRLTQLCLLQQKQLVKWPVTQLSHLPSFQMSGSGSSNFIWFYRWNCGILAKTQGLSLRNPKREIICVSDLLPSKGYSGGLMFPGRRWCGVVCCFHCLSSGSSLL